MSAYPKVKNRELVGTYPALVESGGGYVWDDVLEYRVWYHPEEGALGTEDGDDYYYAFESYEEAIDYAENNPGTESPLALVLQEEYINEPEAGEFVHVKEQRVTEWPVEFLHRPKRSNDTIPNFLAGDTPLNRLEILRGLA